MPPLAILMVVPNYYPYLGGLERQAHTLGAALARRGHAVTVYTRHADRALPAREQRDGVRIVRLPSAAGPLGKDLRFPLALAARLAAGAGRFDVVHLHTKSWFILGCLPPAALWRRPTLVKIPNVRQLGIPGMLRAPLGRQSVWLLRRAGAWAVLSPESRAELVAAGFPPDRIFETRNGVDTGRYAPATPVEREATRAALGLPAERPIALFAGRLAPEKGLADLIAAWAGLPAGPGPRPLLLVCGDGPLRAELEARARAAGVEALFAGPQAEMREHLRAADLFALPSYAEGNSNAMLEAMACGLPALATRVGGTAELLGAEGAPWLVEPGDVAGLRERLARLLADPGLREAAGAALGRRARAHFAIAAIAAHYEQCYAALRAGRPVAEVLPWPS